MKALALALLVVVLPGCAAVKGLFIKPTGKITLDRQEFVDAYGVIEVLAASWLADEEKKCTLPGADAARCMDVARVKLLAKQIQAQVQAKIANPEVQIDKEAVKSLVGILAGLRP